MARNVMLPSRTQQSCHGQCEDMRSIIHAEGVRECLLTSNFRIASDSTETLDCTSQVFTEWVGDNTLIEICLADRGSAPDVGWAILARVAANGTTLKLRRE